MPRAPWRRRRTTDSPRPAGRRWAGRLRRSSTFARQVLLVRVGRRDGDQLNGTDLVLPEHRVDRQRRRYGFDRRGVTLDRAEIEAVVPVSPALGPTAPVDESPAMAIPLLPGARTPARRMKFALVNACTLASLVLGINAIFVAIARPAPARGPPPDRLRRLRRPGRRARPQARCGQPVRRPDGLAGRHVLLRTRRPGWWSTPRSPDRRPTAAAAVAAALVAVLRRDPAGPVQRLAQGRPVLLRRTHDHGGGGARAHRGHRAAAAGDRADRRGGAAGLRDGLQLPVRQAGPAGQAAAVALAAPRPSARWSTSG